MADVIQLRTDAVRNAPPQHLNTSPGEMEKDKVVQTQDSRMRQHWDKVMCKELDIPDRYHHVAILIIRWVKELDLDLQCGGEVGIGNLLSCAEPLTW